MTLETYNGFINGDGGSQIIEPGDGGSDGIEGDSGLN